MAFSAYRMTYASIWDWRFNHIPLNRGSAFTYAHEGADLVDAVFTHRAGWGTWGGSSLGGKHHNGFGTHSGHHNGAGYNDNTIPRRAVGSGGRGPEEMV